MARNHGADNSTIPLGGARTALDVDEIAAIHWVHPKWRPPFPLIESRICAGRGATCQLGLEGDSVSRRHAEIYRQGPIFAVRDLNSTNGTYLNGQRIQHSAIARGDALRLGDYVGVVGTVPTRTKCVDFSELAPGLLGSGSLAKQLSVVHRAAMSGLPILLIGETGVGKGCVARAIHCWTGRAGPWCAVNCAGLPANVAERELFGSLVSVYGKGVQLGSFQQANGGTLLLDEVSELPLGVQARLLHVLEEGIVVPAGQSRGIQVDVRIVATSQRPLSDLVDRGEFRNDFFARLSGATVTLMPLRERREDVVPMFMNFVGRHSKGPAPSCSAEFAESLCLYSWPRNVRELEHLARQMAALLGERSVLERQHLPEVVRGERPTSEVAAGDMSSGNRREHDLHLLVAALKRTHGNVKAAAAALGFSRQRAYRLMNGRTPAELMALSTRADSAHKQQTSSVLDIVRPGGLT